jgi:caffeoyl-CoA O-methyltransferase
MAEPADLTAYVEGLFAREDDLLRELREATAREGLPEIYISAEVGRLLQVLLTAIDARRVVEIGTLGGYSAVWMARALPADGRLVTLELREDRAELARRFVERAGLASRVDVRVGDARATLAELVEREGRSFDAAFIDADKEGYPEYLERSLALVRPGGLILADNAFRDGRILGEDPDEATRGVLAYNGAVAGDDRLVSTIVPIRDGLVVSVVRR